MPPNHVQRFLRAADVVVVPYVRSLNSGALFLALTFGVPVIVPAGGALADAVDDRFAVTYAGGTPGALAEALVRAADLVTPAAREAAREAADARDPVVLSRLFARGLRERLGD